ncbi:multidrug effflux MFS transporter [Desulfogranum marinum]|uniref:multidrug effflux MFS transporter n=1 Tax=Desulfogranum marinum TaxID=453220 RepID=UPI0019636630|nr:multidrug effflux MFS transporter [Desulfogranum marinum]MBM9514740.1 multidrug effflux MFS transporter [Desulfogranum marinum]
MKIFPLQILLLSLLAAFPPLSTDMYLAAIPLLVQQWQQPLVIVNMTLVCFFITYCACLLVYGPLSDKYGRRPPLLFGIALYTLACLLCASSGNVEMLIVSRILQGAGAAAASSIVFAICKDVFTGAQRQRVFVQIGVIVAAAPVIAPVIGAWIMEILTWQWVFLLQAGMASVAFVGVLKMDESLQQKKEEGVWRAFGSYGRLLLNIKYMLLVVTLSIFGMPVFAFIAGSSDLYITRLGYNERQFGYFFALNALAFVFAPLTFSRLARRYAPSHLIPFAFVGMICSALLFLWTAIPMPWRLTVPMFMVTFCFSFCRPGGSNLILEQVDRDAGAASSLMVFAYFLTGSMAMWLFSLEWNDKLQALSIMTCAPVLLALILWGIWYWLDAGKTGGVTVAE